MSESMKHVVYNKTSFSYTENIKEKIPIIVKYHLLLFSYILKILAKGKVKSTIIFRKIK